MRYLICGGGTGGHINPAIAIAKEIEKRDADAVIEFGGSPTAWNQPLSKAGL